MEIDALSYRLVHTRPDQHPEPVRRALNLPHGGHARAGLPVADAAAVRRPEEGVQDRERGQVFLFPGSGTGGWEAGLTNTLSPGDRVLAARIGQFSHLWIDMCTRIGLEVSRGRLRVGRGRAGRAVRRRSWPSRHGRTRSRRCWSPTTRPRPASPATWPACARRWTPSDHPALLFVDGVSSIASIDFRMDEWGVDVAVSGSQKGFMLPTGLAIVAVSQKALAAMQDRQARRAAISTSPT